jgi:hypothetical protein
MTRSTPLSDILDRFACCLVRGMALATIGYFCSPNDRQTGTRYRCHPVRGSIKKAVPNRAAISSNFRTSFDRSDSARDRNGRGYRYAIFQAREEPC